MRLFVTLQYCENTCFHQCKFSTPNSCEHSTKHFTGHIQNEFKEKVHEIFCDSILSYIWNHGWMTHYLLYVWQKVHIQHTVTLIKDKKVQRRECNLAFVYKIQESAWCSNEYVATFLQYKNNHHVTHINIVLWHQKIMY